MSDALTDAVDSQREEGARRNMKDFSLEIAIELKRYKNQFRARNEEKAEETLIDQIKYFVDNKDLDDLYFLIVGGTNVV